MNKARLITLFWGVFMTSNAAASLISGIAVTPSEDEVWVSRYDGTTLLNVSEHHVLPWFVNMDGMTVPYDYMGKLTEGFNFIKMSALEELGSLPITEYNWDFDASNGLSFDDAFGREVEHSYLQNGVYTVSLQVKNTNGESQILQDSIAINPMRDVPPWAMITAQTLYRNDSSLQLQGYAFDANSIVGDSITVGWDLDNDGLFDDASGASPEVLEPASFFSVGENLVRMRVRDARGSSMVVDSSVTLLNQDRPTTKVNEPGSWFLTMLPVLLLLRRKYQAKC